MAHGSRRYQLTVSRWQTSRALFLLLQVQSYTSCACSRSHQAIYFHVSRIILSHVRQLPNSFILFVIRWHSHTCSCWCGWDSNSNPFLPHVFMHSHTPSLQRLCSFSTGSLPASTAACCPNSQSPASLKKQGKNRSIQWATLSAKTSLPEATKWLWENVSTEAVALPGNCFHPSLLFLVQIQ